MRTETKYLGRVVSTGGTKPDPEAVTKIQEWMSPKNKEELQSFLGFASYYRDIIPFHAAEVHPMQELLKTSQHLLWAERHQEAFDLVKPALADATVLAAPNEERRFVLDTDASAVAIAGILHQEQGHNGKTILRPIIYGITAEDATQLWRPEARNVRCILFHLKIPFKPGRYCIHASRGQPSSLVAENILHGPNHDRPLDRTAGPVPFQDDPPTSDATPKRQWTQQEDQRLRPPRTNH